MPSTLRSVPAALSTLRPVPAASSALLPTVEPQGDGALQKLLDREHVTDKLPKRDKAAAARTPAEVIRAAGPGAADLAARLLMPPRSNAGVAMVPSAVDLMQQGIVLFDAKRHPEPDVRVRSVKDLVSFFTRSHRDVRKAVGIEINFSRTIPQLHGLMEKILADPDAPRTADDRDVIERERKLAGKVDVRALHRAALAVVALGPELLAQRAMLLRQPRKKPRTDVTGEILADKELAFGRIVIGGPGRNVYNCARIAVIVDIGGDDEYRGPAASAHGQRRYSVCIDLDGKDVYRCGNGTLGSATYGLGVCIDMAGADDYVAGQRSAGFGAAGVGVFVDVAGDDKLHLGAHSFGVGLMGIGQCFDLAGGDVQRGAKSCFGIGLAAGLGQFVDLAGNDQRHLVGADGRANLGFGAARGLRPDLPGGLGVCMDHAGDDTYTAGDLALGVGDLSGLGVCIDLAGDDSYVAGGLSLGASNRGGVGVMLDVAGKDHYFGTESLAVAGRDGAAFFEDRAGDDIYEVSGAGLGRAGAGGMAFFQDLDGADRFRFRTAALRFVAAAPAGFALFRVLGKGAVFTPASLGPGPKGRRVDTAHGFELRLAR